MRFLLFPAILFAATGSAFAHLGHVGELAGHSHWIAIGAVVTAAALAALIAKGRRSEDEDETSAEAESDATGDGEEQAATRAGFRKAGV